MNTVILILKTIVVYFVVATIFRLMGKREVGQLGTFDLVVFILIAELVALSIEKKEFISHLIPVFILTFLQIFISKLSLKNIKFRKLIDGSPIVIIKNGTINFKNMVDQRYSLDDLLLQLRQKDIKSIDEVDYAILETDGKLSVFKKEDKTKNNSYPLPIIVDGNVEFDNLLNINKTKDWLLNTLIKKNIKVDSIFYAFYKNNDLYIITKDDLNNT